MQACSDKAGTFAGFKRHLRASQELCEACREARNAYNRKYDIKRRSLYKDKLNAQQRARSAKRSPEKKIKDALRLKDYQLKSKYGLTRTEWNVLLERQGNVCAICKQLPDSRGWATDHDHGTGLVRGILCNKCNIRLGLLGDSIINVKYNVSQILKYLSG